MGIPAPAGRRERPQIPGQTFTINMGQRRLFQRLVIDSTANPNDFPRGYIVRGSDNGTTYTNIASGAGDGAVTNIFLPAPVTYQYVQIEQTGSSAASWWSIHELNILQPPTNSPLPFASWRQFYFGADLNDPAKEATHWGNSADLDGDGQSTLEEFAFGTAPNSAASRAPVAVTTATDPVSGIQYFDLTFRRWRTGNGISYLIDYSENLIDWTTEGLNTSFIGSPISNLDGTETVTARLIPQGPVPSSFVRLKLVNTP
ncbi:MAG: discoidin domain-containing protein [Akkermansiaceae bacterium]|nr:discoidin domain-containing protein [Akkermansiaceae bacterium]